MPLQPTYIQLQIIFRSLTWEKTSMIYLPSLDDRSSNTIKAIIYIGTGEVHMHFPSEKVRRYFTDPNYLVEDSKQVKTRRRRRNRNQRRQIIKDEWVDCEGEVTRLEDIQLKHNCPEETVATSQMWKEKIVIHEERRHQNHRLRHLANPRTTEKTENPVRRT